jgi:hypothetical protein
LKLIINNYDKNVSVQLFKNLINQIKKAINDNENIISKIYSFRNKNLGHFQDIPNDKDEMSKSIEIIYDSHNFEKEPNINELLKLSFLIKNIFLSCSSIFDNTNQENLICIPNLFYLEQKNLNILKNVFINCNFFDECHYDYITQFNRNKKTTTLIG